MKRNYRFLIFILASCFATKTQAQVGVNGSGYFQNQYIFNPAMTGLSEKELNLNLAYLRQNNSGADNSAFKTIAGTADYGFNKSIGAGLAVYNDRAGAISSTKIVGTYSFHMSLAEEKQKLHLGFSVIGLQQRVRQDGVTGDPADPAFYNFNTRKMQLESDFGAAYTDDAWTIQATLPNLVALINDRPRDQIFSQSTLFAAASYRLKLTDEGEDQIAIEPKAVYRGFKQTKNIVDAGANVTFLNNILNMYGMYHTNKSVTAGVGYKLDFAQITASYSSAPSALSGFSLGTQYEFGVRFQLPSKK